MDVYCESHRNEISHSDFGENSKKILRTVSNSIHCFRHNNRSVIKTKMINIKYYRRGGKSSH